MADLLARVRVGLTGWPGGPGVNTLYFSPGTGLSWSLTNINGMVEEVHTAYGALSSFFAAPVKIDVSPEVEIIDTGTGKLQDIYTSDAVVTTISAPSSAQTMPYASAVLCRLSTDRFINGRRLQGRLFISPCALAAFDADGQVKDTWADNAEDAFVAMTTGVGPRLAVWHRPTTPTSSDGDWGDVIRVIVPLKPAVLRSRRD